MVHHLDTLRSIWWRAIEGQLVNRKSIRSIYDELMHPTNSWCAAIDDGPMTATVAMVLLPVLFLTLSFFCVEFAKIPFNDHFCFFPFSLLLFSCGLVCIDLKC